MKIEDILRFEIKDLLQKFRKFENEKQANEIWTFLDNGNLGLV